MVVVVGMGVVATVVGDLTVVLPSTPRSEETESGFSLYCMCFCKRVAPKSNITRKSLHWLHIRFTVRYLYVYCWLNVEFYAQSPFPLPQTHLKVFLNPGCVWKSRVCSSRSEDVSSSGKDHPPLSPPDYFFDLKMNNFFFFTYYVIYPSSSKQHALETNTN